MTDFPDNFREDWFTKKYNEFSAGIAVGANVIIDTGEWIWSPPLPLGKVTKVLKKYIEVEFGKGTVKFNLDGGRERGDDTWRRKQAYPATPANLEIRAKAVQEYQAEKELQTVKNNVSELFKEIEKRIKHSEANSLDRLKRLHLQISNAFANYTNDEELSE